MLKTLESPSAREDLQRIRFVTSHFEYLASYGKTLLTIPVITFGVVWFFNEDTNLARLFASFMPAILISLGLWERDSVSNTVISPAIIQPSRFLLYGLSEVTVFLLWFWLYDTNHFSFNFVNLAIALLVLWNWWKSPNKKYWSYYLLLVLGLVILSVWTLVSPNSLTLFTLTQVTHPSSSEQPIFTQLAVFYYDILLYFLVAGVGDRLLIKSVFKYKPSKDEKQNLDLNQLTVPENVLTEILVLLSSCIFADLTALQRLTGVREEKLKVMLDQMVDMELIRLTVKQGTKKKSKYMASITSKGREVLGLNPY